MHRVALQGPRQGSQGQTTAHFSCGFLVVTSESVFIPTAGPRPLHGVVACVAEGCPAAGPGESVLSQCTGPWDSSIRDHVSVPCQAGDRGCCGCRRFRGCSVFAPSRQRDPVSCVTTDVGQAEAPRGVVEVLDRPAALPGKCDCARAWSPGPPGGVGTWACSTLLAPVATAVLGSPRAAPTLQQLSASSLGTVRPSSLFCDGLSHGPEAVPVPTGGTLFPDAAP